MKFVSGDHHQPTLLAIVTILLYIRKYNIYKYLFMGPHSGLILWESLQAILLEVVFSLLYCYLP